MSDLCRRDAMKRLARFGALAAAGGLVGPGGPALAQDDPVLAGRPLVRYPEKTDLILLTSRPPQLETPMKYFDRAITPNEAFFVRYHVFPIPLEVDLATWRLRVTGRVDRPLELTLEDLKTKFPRAAVTAVNQCSGNSRGRFSPRVLGGQWGDGAMGNAEWVGARLKDVLAAAGVRQGAVQATFDGLDKPAFPSVPDFVKSLDITRIMDDPDILIAYQMNGQALTQPEVELPGTDRTRPVICTTSPLRDNTGAALGAVAVFSDLTPLKTLEIERRRAERLAYFEVLASGIGHEIKNPLVSIKTFAQLIARRRDDAKFVDDFSRIVGREIGHIERLLERLNALSRPSDRPPLRLDLRVPIGEALETLQPTFDEKGVTARLRGGDHAAFVLGDEVQLKQLFMNLFINAHEATPPGGTLTIELTATDEHVVVTIDDTGPGIPAALVERIFEPFFSTRQRGSGLGLAICAGIAAGHHARLSASNQPDGGARFTLALPVAATVTAPASA